MPNNLDAIDLTELKSVITALNRKKFAEIIVIRDRTREQLFTDFITTIGEIDTDKNVLPKRVRTFYSDIPEELFSFVGTEEDATEEGAKTGAGAEAAATITEAGASLDEAAVGVGGAGVSVDLSGVDNGAGDYDLDLDLDALDGAEGNTEAASTSGPTRKQKPTPKKKDKTEAVETTGSAAIDPVEAKDVEVEKKKATPKKKPTPKKKASEPEQTGPEKKKPTSKKKVDSNIVEVNSDLFAKFLNRVHLGKVVEECVLTIGSGTATIHALDDTNHVFVKAAIPCPGELGELGIENLSILNKFFKSNKKKDITITKPSDAKLTLSSKGFDILLYQLSDTEIISTYPDPDHDGLNSIEDIIDGYDFVIPAKAEFITSVLDYDKILKTETCVIIIIENGDVCIIGGTSTEHQFKVVIANVDDRGLDLPIIQVFTKYFIQILSNLDFEQEVTFHLHHDASMTIVNGTTAWILSEVQGEE